MMSVKTKIALIAGVIAILGAVAAIIGFWLSGADILGWFTTRYAFVTYFFVGMYVFVLAGLLIRDYASK